MMMPPMGMPGMGQGMGQGMMGPGMGMSMGYSQRTQYTVTGIAGLSGGYAYEPGSGMCQFIDNLNNTMANASMMGQMGPPGMPPMGGGQKPGGNNSSMMIQMFGMMFGLLIAKLAPIIKARLAQRHAGQGHGGHSSHSNGAGSHATTHKPPETKNDDVNGSDGDSDN